MRGIVKLAFFLIFFAIVSYVAMRCFDGIVSTITNEVLSSFNGMTAAFIALSLALFTYIENISREVKSAAADQPSEKSSAALRSLTKFRKEVLSNIALVACLYVMELFTKGTCIALQGKPEMKDIVIFLTSARFSFFGVMLLAGASQIHAFITAIQFRDVIDKT